MDALVEQQSSRLQRLLAISQAADPYLDSTLLIGPSGAGKRTIARAAAESRGLRFLEVRLDASAQQVAGQLFGNRYQADRAIRTGEAPGDAGASTPTLLYLTGLESTDDNLLSQIHRLIARRAYIDAAGSEWRLSDEVWLVAALISPAAASRVHQDHWICATFSLRMHIERPSAPAALVAIARNLCERYHLKLADDAIPVVTGTPGTSDGLHSLRRWLETVALDAETVDTVVGQRLRDTVINDPRWLGDGISYRGCRLTPSMLATWTNQFPEDLRPIALHLVKEIRERYFIGATRFYTAISRIIENSGISSGSSVTFADWQEIGDSGPRIAHVIKNQAKWRVEPDIDLTRLDLLSPNRQVPQWLVLADDFVGSGDTICRLFNSKVSGASALLNRYPYLRVRVLVVAGFEAGLRSIQSAISEYGDRVQLVPGVLFREEDTCFSATSRIVVDPIVRNRLREFCLHAAQRLSAEWRLGYRGLGSLVVYDDSIPNNSLPVLWHDSRSWRALFPRTGTHRLGTP